MIIMVVFLLSALYSLMCLLYMNYRILSKSKFGLQEEVKAFLSLAPRHGMRKAHRQPRVFPVVLVV
jgi:hypothetical protein